MVNAIIINTVELLRRFSWLFFQRELFSLVFIIYFKKALTRLIKYHFVLACIVESGLWKIVS